MKGMRSVGVLSLIAAMIVVGLTTLGLLVWWADAGDERVSHVYSGSVTVNTDLSQHPELARTEDFPYAVILPRYVPEGMDLTDITIQTPDPASPGYSHPYELHELKLTFECPDGNWLEITQVNHFSSIPGKYELRVGDTLALYEEREANDDLVRYITLPQGETVVLISANISAEEIIDTAKGILGESKATLYIGEVSDLNRDPRIIFARDLLKLNVVVPSYLPAGVQLNQIFLFTGTRGMAGVDLHLGAETNHMPTHIRIRSGSAREGTPPNEEVLEEFKIAPDVDGTLSSYVGEDGTRFSILHISSGEFNVTITSPLPPEEVKQMGQSMFD